MEYLLLIIFVIIIFQIIKCIIRDKKEGKCLWCNLKKTGNSHLYYYKEDGIPRSERFYEYKCKKCGRIENTCD